MSRPPRSRRLGVLTRVLLALMAALLLPVLALRWLPVPATAFMLQSETRPVQYQWVTAKHIPEVARRAVVAAEDQKFFDHSGFDVEAMEKAYLHNQKSMRRRGASTISQQTAKNLFLWSGGGYFRKGLEAGYTLLIEALWPKRRILTVYLNIAEFGPGIYGIEAASQAFFKKPASQMSRVEAARLAAVLPSPRRWSVARPGAYVQKRTAWILRQMGYGTTPRPNIAPERDPEPLPSPDEPDDAAPAVDAQAAEQLQRAIEQEPPPAAEPTKPVEPSTTDPAQLLP